MSEDTEAELTRRMDQISRLSNLLAERGEELAKVRHIELIHFFPKVGHNLVLYKRMEIIGSITLRLSNSDVTHLKIRFLSLMLLDIREELFCHRLICQFQMLKMFALLPCLCFSLRTALPIWRGS